jgi:hypothetical protein
MVGSFGWIEELSCQAGIAPKSYKNAHSFPVENSLIPVSWFIQAS